MGMRHWVPALIIYVIDIAVAVVYDPMESRRDLSDVRHVRLRVEGNSEIFTEDVSPGRRRIQVAELIMLQ
jgi:hypothetical protein